MYSKRKDRSFFGGSNLLHGWWFINPYGENGIGEKSPENKKLVFYSRLSFIIIYTSGYAAYKLGEYIN
jgi:hypothetical protein